MNGIIWEFHFEAAVFQKWKISGPFALLGWSSFGPAVQWEGHRFRVQASGIHSYLRFGRQCGGNSEHHHSRSAVVLCSVFKVAVNDSLYHSPTPFAQKIAGVDFGWMSWLTISALSVSGTLFLFFVHIQGTMNIIFRPNIFEWLANPAKEWINNFQIMPSQIRLGQFGDLGIFPLISHLSLFLNCPLCALCPAEKTTSCVRTGKLMSTVDMQSFCVSPRIILILRAHSVIAAAVEVVVGGIPFVIDSI